jgi:hypothetical protein
MEISTGRRVGEYTIDSKLIPIGSYKQCRHTVRKQHQILRQRCQLEDQREDQEPQ